MTQPRRPPFKIIAESVTSAPVPALPLISAG